MTPTKRIKKHRTQMSPAEIEAVTSAVRTLTPKFKCNHIEFRLWVKDIYERAITDALQHGQLIEVNTDGSDLRALIRDTEVAVVIDLHTSHIITAWKNSADDTHSTLRLANYTWKSPIPSTLLPAVRPLCNLQKSTSR